MKSAVEQQQGVVGCRETLGVVKDVRNSLLGDKHGGWDEPGETVTL